MDLSKIKGILDEALRRKASDIHFLAGHPPYLRVFGELNPLDVPALEAAELSDLILGMLSADQRQTLQKNKELDFSYRSH